MEIIAVGLIIVVLIFGFNAWTAFLEKKQRKTGLLKYVLKMKKLTGQKLSKKL